MVRDDQLKFYFTPYRALQKEWNEKDDEVWKSLNCVWKPNEVDPPHVNLMKKAEITSQDGNG